MWSACCVSKSPRFSYTSAKYRIAFVNANASLLLAGRQTLHTQWFERFLLSGGAVRCLYVVLRAFCCGARRLAKRYVCAANSFETLSSLFVVQPADSTHLRACPNVIPAVETRLVHPDPSVAANRNTRTCFFACFRCSCETLQKHINMFWCVYQRPHAIMIVNRCVGTTKSLL